MKPSVDDFNGYKVNEKLHYLLAVQSVGEFESLLALRDRQSKCVNMKSSKQHNVTQHLCLYAYH